MDPLRSSWLLGGKGALEQEVKEEKAALEKPVDLEEEKKQSDGEIVEKAKSST